MQIVKALDRRFGIAGGAEISMEADPGTFDAERLREYMDLGVSRFSIGVQAFQEACPKHSCTFYNLQTSHADQCAPQNHTCAYTSAAAWECFGADQ